MSPLQLVILQWLAAVVVFLLGVGFGRLIEQGKSHRNMVADAERLGRWDRDRIGADVPRR